MDAIAIVAVIVTALVVLDVAAFRSGAEPLARTDDEGNDQLPA